jgi:biotin carboxyl carrier protein
MKKLRITVNGKRYDVEVEVLEDDERHVPGAGMNSLSSTGTPPAGRPPAMPAAPQPARARPNGAPTADPDTVRAPIAGTVRKYFADPGAAVEDRAPLVLLDAMKMDTYIYAPRKGVIAEQCVAVGEPVQAGDVLVRYRPLENQV